MRPITIVTALILSILILPAAPARAGSYNEDFTTTTYKDEGGTTADWNTVAGELRLFPFTPTLLGSFNTPGSAFGVAVSGQVAYVADQLSGLQVIDISDPTTPVLIGAFDTPGSALGVEVDGDNVFVADSATGLLILDVTDPTTPSLIGTYNTPGFASGVAVAGDHAFVADYTGDLQVVDISNPALPIGVGSLITVGRINAVAVAGDHAFLADDSAGVIVVDITDPTNPSSVGGFVSGGASLGITVDGDYAFLADGGTGLRILDISDPTSPTQIGSYNTTGNARAVSVAGDRAFVADDSSGLQVLDITDPTNPTLVQNYNTSGQARDVGIAGTRVLIADSGSGLHLLEISNPMDPILHGSYDTPHRAWDVAIAGNHAFVVDDANGGLQVIDISDLANPILAGNYDTPGLARGIAVDGDLAFIADATSLHVVDITDPANPTFLGDLATPGFARRVAVAGDHVFVADEGGGVQIVDVSDPTNPTLAASHAATGSPRSISVAGNYVYVANLAGLQVIDVTDPTSPISVGGIETLGPTQGVAVSGNYAFLAEGSLGVKVIDISDPTSPSSVGDLLIPTALEVRVVGDHAFVVGDGLSVVDVSNPANPTLVGSSTGSMWGLFVDGMHVFAATDGSGLRVIQVFQDGINTMENAASSLVVSEVGDPIVRARLTAPQSTGAAWMVSADGSTFEIFSPGSWQSFQFPGTELQWISRLDWSPGLDPIVSELEIEYLRDSSTISAIQDIPDDQGRQVRIEWERSGHDFVGDPSQIVEYAVYRQIDPALAATAKASEPLDAGMLSMAAFQHATAKKNAGWDFVTTVPVRLDDFYAVVVPSLADSTESAGQYLSTFMVSALTATPGLFFDSSPDSGYSVDNLAPGVPQNLIADYSPSQVELNWTDAPEADFQFYRVYRDISSGFVPSSANLLQEVTVSACTDAETNPSGRYYKVTAVDHSGNEGPAAAPETATEVAELSPRRFALHNAVPNPFNPTTTLSFELARSGRTSLRVYDLAGRHVATLVDEVRDAGPHEVFWNGNDATGRPVASGVYLYRLEALDRVESKRMTLVK